MDAVLIYDADCIPCSTAARVAGRGDVGVLAWQETEAQRFLEAQYGEPRLALYLVALDVESVYVGRAAAEETARRMGSSRFTRSTLSRLYPGLVDVLDRLQGRRTWSRSGVDAVEPGAEAYLDDLARAAEPA
ncbi:MAG: DUF393 domain-containing protein [Halobacteriales archaeon]